MAILDFRAKLDQLKGMMSTYFSLTRQKFTTLRDRLNNHTEATGNVHGLEASEIGLGNVPNWLPASQEQAEVGNSNNAFMTPKRVDDYANKNIYTVIGDAFQSAADDL